MILSRLSKYGILLGKSASRLKTEDLGALVFPGLVTPAGIEYEQDLKLYLK
jgi:hypothetical protein